MPRETPRPAEPVRELRAAHLAAAHARGACDIQYVIAGEQTRAEVQGRLATLPRGSIVLQRAGEDVIGVLNPTNKTWYEIPSNQNLGALLGTPDVTIEPAGEKATIAR